MLICIRFIYRYLYKTPIDPLFRRACCRLTHIRNLHWYWHTRGLRFPQESRHLSCKACPCREDVVLSGRRKFSAEFKVEAAHRVIDSGRLVSEVAHELTTGEVSLGRWVRDELVVEALKMALVTKACHTRRIIFHVDRGSQGGFNWSSQHSVIVEVRDAAQLQPDRPHGTRCIRWRQRRHGVILCVAAEKRPQQEVVARPRGVTARDRDLDRTDLPSPQAPTGSGQTHSDRI